MRLDLHLHSTASDGFCAPAEVIERAFEVRLDVIALTDHDTTAGVAEAREAAEDLPIHVIPALEVSSTWKGHDIHVLGYFVDPEAPVLARYTEHARSRRAERMREMIARLESIGIDVAFEDVREAAGDEVGSLARPHLAQALVDRGHVSSMREAFDRYIADDGPGFVPTRVQSPTEAVELIRAAEGLAVWAHPPRDRIPDLLPKLVSAGLRGIETYRPNNPPDQVRELESWARRYDLTVTGGSDWHGRERGRDLGRFYLTADEVEAFLEEGEV